MLGETQHLDGALLAARYAFMPNKLRYCGGDKNNELFDYVVAATSDQGLKNMLAEFETMYPYLKLIAAANKIMDPFNYRVVEAYWLGNELLANVSMKDFYRHMIDGQKLKKKFKPKLLEKVFGKIPVGAKPHHSWHVFNIPKRTGYYPVEHTVETMDQCRIGWGQVIKSLNHPPRRTQVKTGENIELLNQKSKKTNHLTNKLLIEYEPLVIENGKIGLGKLTQKEVWSEVNNQSLAKELKVGDWVSLHWDWVCDILTNSQVNNLKKWTQYNLHLTNI